MATALVIEEESGTSSGFAHPHNGYYAGDFRSADRATVVAPVLAPVFERATAGVAAADSVLQMVPGVVHIDDRAVAWAA